MGQQLLPVNQQDGVLMHPDNSTRMSATDTNSGDIIESVSQDADGEQIANTLNSLVAEVNDLREENNDLREENNDLREEISNLREDQEKAARDRAETKQRVSSLEEGTSEDTTPTPEPDNNGSTTPIEQLSNSDDPDAVTSSASVKRAVSLFENITKWGSKAPKGIVLKPDDNPLSLLEADRGEQLCWKQYYRGAKSLEQLSKGGITFFDSDRHGKMLLLHKQSELYDRITNEQLSPSSAQAPT